MHFCRSCFFQPWFHSDAFWFFWILLVFVISNKYYQRLMLLNFHCQKTSFLCKYIFYWWEHTQWNLDAKAKKYFVKVFHVSWNALGIVFHEMMWKNYLTTFIKNKYLSLFIECVDLYCALGVGDWNHVEYNGKF